MNCKLLVLSCIITITSHAQNDQSISLQIGDRAPSLRVRKWIKGEPVHNFEEGQIYVVEFWATWCRPCIASMPHLSDLAVEYKDRVVIVGIDIHEDNNTSLEKVKAFVDSMGYRMNYRIATEDTNFTEADWFTASGERGIPNSFIIDTKGKLAWIGHPKGLDEVLLKIVDNKWDIKDELAKRNLNKHLEELDKEVNFELNLYVGNAFKPGDLGHPDSALLLINEILKKEPKLKYAPFVASHTFTSLLKTDPKKAYEFGKQVLVTSSYGDPPYNLIIGSIKWYSDKLDIPANIYELGAEAYHAIINTYGKFGNIDIPKNYKNMADMYWRAKNKSKAIEAIQKAIETLKKGKDFSANALADFESLLHQYKNM